MNRSIARRLSAFVVALLCSLSLFVASPASANSDERALKRAVHAYSDAFLSGHGAVAYRMISGRCKAKISRTKFLRAVDMASDLYGPLRIKSLRVIVSGRSARATYTYAVRPLNQRNEPWLKVSGRWRMNEC